MKQFLEKLPFYNRAVLPYHYLQALLAGLKYRFPAKDLTVIAVTGTNGKTTTAFMIWQMLNSAGKKAGLMTTVAWGVKKLTPELGHMTTVDAFTLNRRIEAIKNQGAKYLVLEVTSHALEKVFESVKNHKGRIISVHGGAGRRDPSTRPIRGEILAKNSDIVIITEDDSRDEDPERIADGFMKGAKKAGKIEGKNLFKELDRKKAIALAFEKAKPGDLVLLLGKGHEKTILRADGPHPFEDLKVACELLRASKKS